MGKLIVIEGTDGSGKETQINLLAEKLKERNINFKKVDFPNYNSPSSSLVKMYLSGEFGEDAKQISPYISSTFFAADRYATYKTELEEFYQSGGIILADRYTTANMIHQGGKMEDIKKRREFLNWLWNLEFNIYGIPIPDKVFFLNMPINYSEKLMEYRKNKFDKNAKKDIHERDEKHLLDTYKAALEIMIEYNWQEVKCVAEGRIRTKEDISYEIFNSLDGIV